MSSWLSRDLRGAALFSIHDSSGLIVLRVISQKMPPVDGERVGASVKTTPQMTRFRDATVCSKWLQARIDDHSMQSDYKCTIGLQNPEGKNSTLGIASAW